MIVKCMACRKEMALNPATLLSHEGHVKCFACGAMMKVVTSGRSVASVDLLGKSAGVTREQGEWRGSEKTRTPGPPGSRYTPWRKIP